MLTKHCRELSPEEHYNEHYSQSAIVMQILRLHVCDYVAQNSPPSMSARVLALDHQFHRIMPTCSLARTVSTLTCLLDPGICSESTVPAIASESGSMHFLRCCFHDWCVASIFEYISRFGWIAQVTHLQWVYYHTFIIMCRAHDYYQ